jgi:hypothetical protein
MIKREQINKFTDNKVCCYCGEILQYNDFISMTAFDFNRVCVKHSIFRNLKHKGMKLRLPRKIKKRVLKGYADYKYIRSYQGISIFSKEFTTIAYQHNNWKMIIRKKK